MNVKQLIDKLNTFDYSHPVVIVVKNESLRNELPIENVVWEGDYLCKIIIDGE